MVWGVLSSDVNEKELARARNAAYRYLAVRPRSRAEVRERLQDRGFSPAVIDSVMAHLSRLGYINDEEFAGLWIESRVKVRSFGKRRLRQELRDKGVEGELIGLAIERHLPPEREAEAAKKAAESKLRSLRGLEREIRRRRLAGFLERKGFSFEVIREIMRTTD